MAVFGSDLASLFTDRIVHNPHPFFLETVLLSFRLYGTIGDSELLFTDANPAALKEAIDMIEKVGKVSLGNLEGCGLGAQLVLHFVNSLPAPLMPLSFWDAASEALEFPMLSTKLRIFNSLLSVLPEENFLVLKLLLRFVAEHMSANPTKKKLLRRVIELFEAKIVRPDPHLDEKKAGKVRIEMIKFLVRHYEYFFEISEVSLMRDYEQVFSSSELKKKAKAKTFSVEFSFRKSPKRGLNLLLLDSFGSLSALRDFLPPSPFRTSLPLRMLEIFAESKQLSEMMVLLVEAECRKIVSFEDAGRFVKDNLLADMADLYFESLGSEYLEKHFSKVMHKIEVVSKKVSRSFKKLASRIEALALRFLEVVSSSLLSLPSEILDILSRIITIIKASRISTATGSSLKVRSAKDEKLYLRAAFGFLFSRLFVSCITDPNRYGFQIVFETESQRSFNQLLGTVLEGIATATPFPNSEKNSIFNDLIEESQPTLSKMVDVLMGAEVARKSISNVLLTTSFRKDANPAPEFHLSLLGQIDSIFAKGIETPSDRTEANPQLDIQVAKDIKKLLLAWPKSQVPPSVRAATQPTKEAAEEPFTYFPVVLLTQRVSEEWTQKLALENPPLGKKCFFGFNSKFLTLCDPSDKDKRRGCWAVANILYFEVHCRCLHISFLREPLHIWITDKKDVKKLLNLICEATGTTFDVASTDPDSCDSKHFFHMWTPTQVKRKLSRSEKSWWLQKQEVKRVATSVDNLSVLAASSGSQLNLTDQGDVGGQALLLITSCMKFVSALTEAITSRFELTMQLKRKFGDPSLKDCEQALLVLYSQLLKKDPSIPELLDVVRNTKVILERSRWLVEAQNDMPPLFHPKSLTSVPHRLFEVQEALKSLILHLSMSDPIFTPQPTFAEGTSYFQRTAHERRSRSIDLNSEGHASCTNLAGVAEAEHQLLLQRARMLGSKEKVGISTSSEDIYTSSSGAPARRRSGHKRPMLVGHTGHLETVAERPETNRFTRPASEIIHSSRYPAIPGFLPSSLDVDQESEDSR